jgi:hypothetical protein
MKCLEILSSERGYTHSGALAASAARGPFAINGGLDTLRTLFFTGDPNE